MSEYNYTEDKELGLKFKDQKEMKCYICGINIGDIIDICWYHFIGKEPDDTIISAPYCPECEKIESNKIYKKSEE